MHINRFVWLVWWCQFPQLRYCGGKHYAVYKPRYRRTIDGYGYRVRNEKVRIPFLRKEKHLLSEQVLNLFADENYLAVK